MEKHSIFKQKDEFNFLSALELPGGDNQFSESNKRTHGGKKKSKKGGRPSLPFVSPRSAWPMPHSPDLLSPTSACCNYCRDVIQIPKILTQDSNQAAVWTQLWGADSTVQHNTQLEDHTLVVGKVGGVVRERPPQNFITAIVWCLFSGVRWMWSPRANQSTCLSKKPYSEPINDLGLSTCTGVTPLLCFIWDSASP